MNKVNSDSYFPQFYSWWQYLEAGKQHYVLLINLTEINNMYFTVSHKKIQNFLMKAIRKVKCSGEGYLKRIGKPYLRLVCQ